MAPLRTGSGAAGNCQPKKAVSDRHKLAAASLVPETKTDWSLGDRYDPTQAVKDLQLVWQADFGEAAQTGKVVYVDE